MNADEHLDKLEVAVTNLEEAGQFFAEVASIVAVGDITDAHTDRANELIARIMIVSNDIS